MKRSDSIVKLAASLLKAQKLMGGATKGAANPYFKSKYADYGSVLEACKDLLNENGVIILQPHTTSEAGEFVETILMHESGEWLSSETKVVAAKQNDPQALGSAITYARRYGLQSLLAMPAEDDDGEKAMARPSAAPSKKEEAFKASAASAPKAATLTNSPGTPATKSSFKSAAPAVKPAVEEAKPAVAEELGW